MAYGEQIRQKKKENAKGELRPGGEFLYKIKKDDKIYPISILVIYLGKEEWDGPKSLHDMLDWGEGGEEVKKLVSEYPIHFLDLSKIEQTECSKMDDESWDVLGKVTNSPKLINKFKSKVEENKAKVEENKAEEEGNVCRALQEFYDDGIAEGKAVNLIEMVCRKIAKGKEVSQIAEELEEDENTIKKIYDTAMSLVPDYDAEKIYKLLHDK